MPRSDDTDSEKQRSRTSKRNKTPPPPPPPSKGPIICLRVTQIIFAIGVMTALGISWYVRSYGSVFNSHDNAAGIGGAGMGGFGAATMGTGLGPEFGGGFGGGFGSPMGGGGFGILGPGVGGEDGLGFSEYGTAFGFYHYPFSSIAYTFAMVVAGLSFVASIAMIFLSNAAMVQVGVDVLLIVLWITCSSMLATGTSICLPHDRDRMFIGFQIQEMAMYLPWNFAAQFEFNIQVYCGGVFGAIVVGFLLVVLFIVTAARAFASRNNQ